MRKLALAAALLVTIAGVGVSTPAQAEGYCYGDECVGLNPTDTTCVNDAVTIGGMNVEGGMLDLRWSPSCDAAWGRYSYNYSAGEWITGTQTSHARVTVWNPGHESQGGGHTADDSFGQSWWTNMVPASSEVCTGAEIFWRHESETKTHSTNRSLGWTWGPCHS